MIRSPLCISCSLWLTADTSCCDGIFKCKLDNNWRAFVDVYVFQLIVVCTVYVKRVTHPRLKNGYCTEDQCKICNWSIHYKSWSKLYRLHLNVVVCFVTHRDKYSKPTTWPSYGICRRYSYVRITAMVWAHLLTERRLAQNTTLAVTTFLACGWDVLFTIGCGTREHL